MASSTPANSTHQSSASSSHFTKTVTLYDWWLIKTESEVEGKNLGVSGTTSTLRQAVRVFSSAPIVKRYDVFTVETADGIRVLLKSYICNQKTVQSGFPSKVARSFSLGFPNDWERYAEKRCPENVTTTADQKSPASSSVHEPTGAVLKESPTTDHSEAYLCASPRTEMKTSNSALLSSNPDVLFQPTGQLQQPLVPKVTDKAANSKPGHNSRNRKPKEDEKTTAKKAKTPTTPGNKIQRKINFDEQATQQDAKGKCVVSPECLSVGRSRSGRILLPTLEFWRNQIPIYDLGRNVTGIQENTTGPVPERGSRCEPQKKRKQLR